MGDIFFSLNEFQQTLDKQNIDLDLLDVDSFQASKGKGRYTFPCEFRGDFLISKPNNQRPVAIIIENYRYGDREREINLISPWPFSDLNNLNDFAKAQEEHFACTEKIIRAIYNLKNKNLPPVKLEFKPQTTTPQEFLASCGYCGKHYFTAQDPTCPGCGACDPLFMIKG